MADSSSSSESGDEKRQIMAEIAGLADKDVTNAHLVNREVERRNKLITSRRNEEAFEEQEEQNYLTPEFKRHIAKKLSSYLDGCIQEQPTCSVKIKGKSQASGIQLFHSSRDKLMVDEKDQLEPKISKIKKRPRQLSSSSESSYDEDALARFEEAAVCGHSIIDKGYLSSGNNCINNKSIRSGDGGVLSKDDEDDKVKKNKKMKKQNNSKNKDSLLENNELNHIKQKKKKKKKKKKKISKIL